MFMWLWDIIGCDGVVMGFIYSVMVFNGMEDCNGPKPCYLMDRYFQEKLVDGRKNHQVGHGEFVRVLLVPL